MSSSLPHQTDSAAFPAEVKRQALDQVLHSNTFARADQLKRFLQYVCEMEMQGQAENLNEYRIGIEALGKPEDFSPTDDTSVRNRAYALRKKLDKYYEDEDPGALVRIEFVKGTYIPRFVDHAHAAHVATVPTLHVRRSPYWMAAAGLAAGIAIGAALVWLALPKMRTGTPAVDAVVRQAWGPLLQPGGEVLVSLGTPAQMTLLPFDVKMEWRPELPRFEAPRALMPWYVRHHRLFSGTELFMTPDINSPHFGDVMGATTVMRTLVAGSAGYKLLPERVVPTALLNSRNAVLFGVPYKSEAVLKLLEKTPFQFQYRPELRDVAITFKDAASGSVRSFVPGRDERNDRVESFSLITVMPRDLGGGRVGRLIAFSGDPSAGAAAAAEFFSSPQDLAALAKRMGVRDGNWPAAYQVLLRCKLDSNLPVSYAYEAHAVLP